MTKQIINIGSSELAGDGESIRSAFNKVNENFDEVYTLTDDIGFSGTNIYSLLGMEINNSDPIHGWTARVSVPENGSSSTGVVIQNNYGDISFTAGPDFGNLKTWQLSRDGRFIFPDGSAQTTAFALSTATTAPSLTPGKLWFNSAEGRLYINYNNTWVEASPTQIDPSAIRYNNLNQIELPPGGDIVDSDGNSVLGGGTGTPGGTNTQIQFNNNGQFGGYANFTFSTATDTLQIPNNGTIKVSNGNLNILSLGGKVSIQSTGTYNWDFGTDGTLTLPYDSKLVTFNYKAVELTAGDHPSSYASLASNNSNQYIWVDNYGAYIGTNWTATAQTWIFDTTGIMTTPGSIIPDTDLAYDLGSTSSQWRSLYVGTSTIYVGGTPISVINNTLVVGTASGDTPTTSTSLATEGFVIDYVAANGVSGGSSAYTQNLIFVNDVDSRTFNNTGSVAINFTAYTGGPGFNTSWQYQSPLNESIGITILAATIASTASSISTTTGALTVAGGVGIGGDVVLGGTLTLPDGGKIDTNFNGGIQLVAGAGGTVRISSNNDLNYWIFDNDGRTLLPLVTVNGGTSGWLAANGDLTLDAGSQYWKFGQDGNLTFPDASVQTEAWNHANFVAEMETYDGEIVTNTATIGVGGLVVNGPVTFNGPFTYLSTATTQVTGNTGTFFGDVSGVNALYAGVAGYSPLPATVFQSSANVNDYIQNNFQNLNNGATASTEWVATANNGNDTNCYIDLGIAGSNWNGTQANSVGTAAQANDAWVYTQGNTANSEGGNLILGTIKNGKAVKILIGPDGTSSVSAEFKATGLKLNTGTITFANGTVQSTAWTGTVAWSTIINAPDVTGYTGSAGTNGTTGFTGSAGTNGTTGFTGSAGTNGFTGSIGYTGSSGIWAGGTLSGTATVATFIGTATASSTQTGAVQVQGGLGVGGNLYANTVYSGDSYFRGATGNGYIQLSTGGIAYFLSDIVLNGATSNIKGPGGYPVISVGTPSGSGNTGVKFYSTATVAGTTESTSTATGALLVSGGAGIAKNVYVGGNVTANKFIGDGSSLTNVTVNVAGNIVGTSSNVTLVAGSYSYTFDNTGVATFPAVGGDEGGEINFGVPTSNTTLSNAVKLDVYQNRIRFFDGSTKGVYIDLSQAATGVGTLLNNRVSAASLALNTSLTLDNLAVQIKTQSLGVWIFLATVSGSATYQYAVTYQLGGGGNANAQGTNSTMSATTTPATVGLNSWYFSLASQSLFVIVTDTTNNKMYRITWMTTTGSSPYGNFVSIERLV